MTKKRFFKLRQALITKVIQNAKAEGNANANGHYLYRMQRPNFGVVIAGGEYEGEVLTSYKQAWECFKPLRDALKMP